MTGGKQGKIVNKDSVGEPNSPAAAENATAAVHWLHADRLQCAAFLAKSLADGNRLKILLLLSEGRKSVSAIVEALDLSQPLVSHHLKELRR